MLLYFLLFGLALGFSASGTDNVAVYWGQNSLNVAGGQQRLSSYCQDTSADIILLSFLNVFFSTDGLPQVNFAASCNDGSVFPGTSLLQCPEIAADIATCQANGKKILLSLGGAAGVYGFTDESQAESFADELWNMFGAGTSSTRPFGTSIVDGFDLDIEGGSSTGYAAFSKQMRVNFNSDSSKQYYMSAAPQCPIPDFYVNDAIVNSDIDFVFVQFYNNYCGMNVWEPENANPNFNFAAWDQLVKGSANPNAKVYLGVPASASAAGTGYTPISTVLQAADYLKETFSSFGGIMMWDASQAWANVNDGVNFAQAAKQGLLGGSPSTPETTTTIATVAATSSTEEIPETSSIVQTAPGIGVSSALTSSLIESVTSAAGISKTSSSAEAFSTSSIVAQSVSVASSQVLSSASSKISSVSSEVSSAPSSSIGSSTLSSIGSSVAASSESSVGSIKSVVSSSSQFLLSTSLLPSTAATLVSSVQSSSSEPVDPSSSAASSTPDSTTTVTSFDDITSVTRVTSTITLSSKVSLGAASTPVSLVFSSIKTASSAPDSIVISSVKQAATSSVPGAPFSVKTISSLANASGVTLVAQLSSAESVTLANTSKPVATSEIATSEAAQITVTEASDKVTGTSIVETSKVPVTSKTTGQTIVQTVKQSTEATNTVVPITKTSVETAASPDTVPGPVDTVITKVETVIGTVNTIITEVHTVTAAAVIHTEDPVIVTTTAVIPADDPVIVTVTASGTVGVITITQTPVAITTAVVDPITTEPIIDPTPSETTANLATPSSSLSCPVNNGDCEVDGSLSCSGQGFAQCVFGKWVIRPCAVGTVCQALGDSVYCGWAVPGQLDQCSLVPQQSLARRSLTNILEETVTLSLRDSSSSTEGSSELSDQHFDAGLYTNGTSSSTQQLSDSDFQLKVTVEDSSSSQFLGVIVASTVNNTPINDTWSFTFHSDLNITGVNRGQLSQIGTNIYQIESIPISEPPTSMAIIVSFWGSF